MLDDAYDHGLHLMYGETGAAMRQQFAALLRQHRVQQRLGGTLNERAEELGVQIRQYRQTVLVWCRQALRAASPLTFSNHATGAAEPVPLRRVARRRHDTAPANSPARSTSPSHGVDRKDRVSSSC